MITNSCYSQEVHGPYELHDIGNQIGNGLSSVPHNTPADRMAEWRLIPNAEFRPIDTVHGHLALFGADPNALAQLDKNLGELPASQV